MTLSDWPAVASTDLLVPVLVVEPVTPEITIEDETAEEEIVCEVEKVVLADGSSKIASMFTVPEIPYSHSIQVPQYWPQPFCGLSTADVEFKIKADGSSSLPSWLRLEEGSDGDKDPPTGRF